MQAHWSLEELSGGCSLSRARAEDDATAQQRLDWPAGESESCKRRVVLGGMKPWQAHRLGFFQVADDQVGVAADGNRTLLWVKAVEPGGVRGDQLDGPCQGKPALADRFGKQDRVKQCSSSENRQRRPQVLALHFSQAAGVIAHPRVHLASHKRLPQ